MKYYAFYDYLDWRFILKATADGLSDLYLYTGEDLSTLKDDPVKMQPYLQYLDLFFSGADVSELVLDLKGSEFQIKVWNELRTVKPGDTASYKDIAEHIGKPKSSQAVGNAVGSNPVMLFVPCHRIIKSDGSIGGFSSDPELKKYLLNIQR